MHSELLKKSIREVLLRVDYAKTLVGNRIYPASDYSQSRIDLPNIVWELEDGNNLFLDKIVRYRFILHLIGARDKVVALRNLISLLVESLNNKVFITEHHRLVFQSAQPLIEALATSQAYEGILQWPITVYEIQ